MWTEVIGLLVFKQPIDLDMRQGFFCPSGNRFRDVYKLLHTGVLDNILQSPCDSSDGRSRLHVSEAIAEWKSRLDVRIHLHSKRWVANSPDSMLGLLCILMCNEVLQLVLAGCVAQFGFRFAHDKTSDAVGEFSWRERP